MHSEPATLNVGAFGVSEFRFLNHRINRNAVDLVEPKTLLSRRPRVLVVGLTPSLTWKVAHCLLLAGCRPTVLGWHRWSPMQLYKGIEYVHWRGVRWIDDNLDSNLILQIEAECAARDIEVVVGADYPSILLLSQKGEEIRSSALVPIPHEPTLRLLNNKWNFSQLLTKLRIPQPKTELALNVRDLLGTQLAFPIITKPVDLWASVGFEMHTSIEELRQRLDTAKLRAAFPLLVQEYIPGCDVGFAFTAFQGRIQAYAAFEVPEKGVRKHFESVRLLNYVAAIVEETGYSGVGEIDARYDPARDEYRLLEVNPRFWASVLYTQIAGMNFPDLLLRPAQIFEAPGFSAQTAPIKIDLVNRSKIWSLDQADRLFMLLNG
jgi:ATP-grasp in the biosynthetic pathway with Ter operon